MKNPFQGGVINGSVTITGASSSYAPHIHTRAARTKAGWVGQVWLDGDIVWESEPTVTSGGETRPRSEAEAYTVAKDRVRVKLVGLLG